LNIRILVDNNTLIDRYFLAEPGLSLLIRDDESTVLFDTGYSDIFLSNAAKMGLDLSHLDYLVLSHSHLDHTWGIEPFIKYCTEMEIEQRSFSPPTIVAHPQTFVSASAEGYKEFGSLISEAKLAKHFPLKLSTEPVKLNSRLTFLGEIPRLNDFEGSLTFGRKEGADVDDHVIEDSALVYNTSKGLVIITGCSHSGICNIIEYARKVCNNDRVIDIIGGLHLQEPPKHQLEGTLSYLKDLQPTTVHACHCTDLSAKIALSSVVNIKEVGVGLSIKYED
jgi:7,8-dihydropterin-6-yl-methyl-4-(beta-D-ribofuranosyl)aminobenzene 5'-phosphate synthase